MKKNKEWLKRSLNEIGNAPSTGNDNYDEGFYKAFLEIEKIVHQLEEPEQEKVVVPQFVADYIERSKNTLTSLSYALSKWGDEDEPKKFVDWFGIDDNEEVFARAWLDGYTVEKEKLYHVPLHDGTYLVSDDDKNLSKGTTYFMHQEDSGFLNRVHIFTEQEIKSIDERYWSFAEEVPD